MAATTLVVSPFARLEGDLRVSVDVEDGRVVRAFASGTLFRGFEAMLKGRNPMDALVITCRVCGQCGLTHSAAAAAAIRALSGTQMPPNASIALNVMLAVETVISHFTHFYLSFAPELVDLSRDPRAARRYLPPAGTSFARALREREELLGVLGLFVGKWPNSLAIQPGGTTRPVDLSEIRRARALLGEYVAFVEQQVLGGALEEWLGLTGWADLDGWMAQGVHGESDIGLFVRIALDGGLQRIGAWQPRFVSSGGWAGPTGATFMRPGFHDGRQQEFDPSLITEEVARSWYDPPEGSLRPLDGETEPAPERPGAYSWAKAPRYAGKPAEAGPLARLMNDGDALVTDLVRRYGASAFVRETARLHETMRLLGKIGEWLAAVDPREPFMGEMPRPGSGCGMGLVEAPRGILGHWIRVEEGRIQNYQIITPTGWNLSPRGADDCPGPVEEALVGAPVADADRPAAVSAIVKSFDPCLYCTVH